jgi:hypothetical protein
MKIRYIVIWVCFLAAVAGLMVAAWLRTDATLAGRIATECAILLVVGTALLMFPEDSR